MKFWEKDCTQEEFNNGALSIYHENIQDTYKVFHMRSRYYDVKYYNKDGRITILINGSPNTITKYHPTDYSYPIANKNPNEKEYTIVNIGQSTIKLSQLEEYNMLLGKLQYTIEQMNNFEKYVNQRYN